MSERGNGAADEGSEFLLEADESNDLETAFREALDAVDRDPGKRKEEDAADPAAEESAGDRVHEELQDTQNRLMRALADFDNFRKRVERERADDRRYQGADVLRDLLPVVDNLERALEAGGTVEDLKTGVRLTLKQMAELLERHGVRRIDAVGTTFDPRYHEALTHHPDTEVEEPTVSRELEAGYMMKERLLRAARVAVAMPSAPKEEEPPSG